jgi:putative ABC transport system permease protein
LPETLPRINEIGINWQVVVFALLLALLTGALCGLAPAFAGLRTKVNDTLKEGGRSGSQGSGHARLRSGLVVGEIAIPLVLLAACGLLLRSFEKCARLTWTSCRQWIFLCSLGERSPRLIRQIRGWSRS